jgi:hypothetical protein
VFEHLVEGDTVCCHLAGAVLTYDPKAKMYERVRSVVLLPSRKRIESKRTYTLAVSDQLTGGGTFALGASECAAPFGCARSGLLGRWPFEDGGSTTREALVAYLRRLPQPVTTPEDRRQVPRP